MYNLQTSSSAATESEQFCTFYVGGLFFGVEVLKVQEVLTEQDMTPVPLASEEVRGLINLRGQIVTAIDLRMRLGLGQRRSDEPAMNVVVNTDDGVFSLLVDEIGDVIEPDGKAFERPPETLRGVARQLVDGVYKLNGELLLILDTKAAVALNEINNVRFEQTRNAHLQRNSNSSKNITMETQQTSLFERLGGAAAIDAAVDQFYDRVLADEDLAPFFDEVVMPRQIKQQKAFLTTATGGPSIYKGRDMKEAHAHLPIQEKHFGLVAKHLVETLASLDVAQELIDEVVALVSPLAEAVVNTPSN